MRLAKNIMPRIDELSSAVSSDGDLPQALTSLNRAFGPVERTSGYTALQRDTCPGSSLVRRSGDATQSTAHRLIVERSTSRLAKNIMPHIDELSGTLCGDGASPQALTALEQAFALLEGARKNNALL